MLIGIIVNICINIFTIIVSLVAIWFILQPKLLFTIEKKVHPVEKTQPKKIEVNRNMLKLMRDGRHSRIHISDEGLYVNDLGYNEQNDIVVKEGSVLFPKILSKKEIDTIDILSSDTFWANK